jgi:uncharacterized protein YecT (DUF1311 family)
MRALALALTILLLPAAAIAETDIGATCYKACESSTTSNPAFKACLARTADAADRKLNEACKTLQADIRTTAREMAQSPDIQLSALTRTQKKWIAYRDDNCTFEDAPGFGGTAIGGNYSACLCALSYKRIADFAHIRRHLLLGD